VVESSAKELLDKADIRAALKHLRGASVAKQVAVAAFAQFRAIDVVRTSWASRLRFEGVGQETA
jgi:hypothetical protein